LLRKIKVTPHHTKFSGQDDLNPGISAGLAQLIGEKQLSMPILITTNPFHKNNNSKPF
jgi:hypothetical protein